MLNVTQQTWNKVAEVYHEKFMDVSEYGFVLDRFCEMIPREGSTMLEIGCGPGNLTKFVQDKRRDISITAIDYAANMIELAKKLVPTANFSVKDARDIDSLNASFDAVLCGFCLPYLDIDAVEKLFHSCAAMLKTGGVFYCSFIEGDYALSGYKTASTGDMAFVHYYKVEQVSLIANKSGLGIVETFTLPKPSKNGYPADECIMIFRQKD